MDSLRPARAELMLAGMHPSERVHPSMALRSYVASTSGMISCFSRLRSSVFETGASVNGGQMSSTDSTKVPTMHPCLLTVGK